MPTDDPSYTDDRLGRITRGQAEIGNSSPLRADAGRVARLAVTICAAECLPCRGADRSAAIGPTPVAAPPGRLA